MINSIVTHSENGYLISTDKSKLDVDYIHNFLTHDSYWAAGIPKSYVEESIRHAWCFGVYHEGKQVGFARVITDFTTFAYLGDVFIDAAHRGKGLSKMLMRFIMSQPAFARLRRFILATRDAHTLYDKFGFKPLKSPDRFLELHQPDVYKALETSSSP